MTELSIIIPVYNVERYIHRCVDSVIKEAPSNCQIILVDDGSQDSCPMICDEYALQDERIEVIHKTNSGLSGARNTGLQKAIGRYIFFLDSDDYLQENYFKTLFHEEADLMIGAFEAFYSNGIPPYALNICSKRYSSIKEYLSDFYQFYPVTFNTVWGKIYRRDILEQYNIRFREDLFMVEDILFNIDYYPHCSSILYESDAKLMYRQGNGTLSKKQNDKLFSWYEESYSQIKALLEQFDVFEGENQRMYYRRLFGNTVECLVGMARTRNNKINNLCESICNYSEAVKASEYCENRKLKAISFAIKRKNRMLIKLTTSLYVFALELKALGRIVNEYLYKDKE